MNVKELIKALKKMPQDLEVYGYCDHGQSPEKVCDPFVRYAGNDHQTLYDDWTVDEDDALELNFNKKFVLL